MRTLLTALFCLGILTGCGNNNKVKRLKDDKVIRLKDENKQLKAERVKLLEKIDILEKQIEGLKENEGVDLEK